MIPLTDEENKFYEKQKVCYICKKGFSTDDDDNKKYQKVRDHCHYTEKFRGAAHSICNLRYKTANEIPVVLHNGSTYDCHFIIKQLAKEFHGPFECLGENTEKYITFSVPIEKELHNGKTIKYKLKFIESFRFILTSLSKLFDNLSEIYSKKCKGGESVCDLMELEKNKLLYKYNECKKKTIKTNKWVNEKVFKYILIL